MRHVLIGAVLAVATGSPVAAETVSYGYDVFGRLVGVGRLQGPMDGYRDDFSYDAADNRSYYWAANTTFTLNPGDQRASADGRTRLVMQSDGNLVVYFNGNTALWATYTSGAGNRAAFQSDGNLVVYDRSNRALWSSGTGGRIGALLIVADDGNVAIADVSRNTVWASNTGGH